MTPSSEARSRTGRRCTRATATITIVGERRKSSTGDQRQAPPPRPAEYGKRQFEAGIALLSAGVHPSATATAAAAAETTRHIVSVTKAIDIDNKTLT